MIHWLRRKLSEGVTLNAKHDSMIDDLKVDDVVDVMDGDKHMASYGLVDVEKQIVIPSKHRRVWNINVGGIYPRYAEKYIRKIISKYKKRNSQ